MKKIRRWLKDYFAPGHDMDVYAIGEALNDPATRTYWLAQMLDDIHVMNIDVDRKLLMGSDFRLSDLCARRKAYQDVLEAILSARRAVTQGERHNPRVQVPVVDLDRVTA